MNAQSYSFRKPDARPQRKKGTSDETLRAGTDNENSIGTPTPNPTSFTCPSTHTEGSAFSFTKGLSGLFVSNNLTLHTDKLLFCHFRILQQHPSSKRQVLEASLRKPFFSPYLLISVAQTPYLLDNCFSLTKSEK